MKRVRRLVTYLLFVFMIGCLCVPSVQADASSNVKIIFKNKTKQYKKKKTSVYVNSKKISLSKTPAFMKSGSYMGPADTIFKKSSLKVTYSANSTNTKLTLTYNGHTLKLTSGSTTAYLDGKKTVLGTAPMYATYKTGKYKRWIVPIKSVCTRLGITYKYTSTGKITLSSQTASATSSDSTVVSADNTGKVVICMDAGHGGTDTGASNKAKGKLEKNMTLAIVKAAKTYFDKDSRFQVYYTRTSDTYPSLTARCSLANTAKADLFICVHINDAASTSTGTETLYNKSRNSATAKNGITSYQLATAMQKVAQKSTGFRNRGLVNRTDLRVLNKTTMPACLIEYGFISNPTECTVMNANLTRYGKELYNGIVSFLQSKGKIK